MKKPSPSRQQRKPKDAAPIPFKNYTPLPTLRTWPVDPELTTRNLDEVCMRLVRKGYRREVEEFLRPIAAKGDTPMGILDDQGVPTEEGKAELSIRLWDLYLEKGEGAVLKMLPSLLHTDCVFFLGQRWVRELIAKWLQEGAQAKIERVFFGTPKPGVRSYETVIKTRQRDFKIAAEVEVLLEKGCGKREAMRLVEKNLKRLHITDPLTDSQIRHIYEKRKKGYDPLLHLLAVR